MPTTMDQISTDGHRRVLSYASQGGSVDYTANRFNDMPKSPGKFSTMTSDSGTPSAYPTSPSVLPATATQTTKRQRFAAYRALSWMFGFRETWSLMLCSVFPLELYCVFSDLPLVFIFGGALLGFCLARSESMDPAKIKRMTVAGEFFWFDRDLFRVNYFIHIYMTIIGGICVGLQFVPRIRRNYVLLHRINGYFCLFQLVVGNICGGIVAYKSFGGELNAQFAYYVMGIMTVFSGLMGLYNVKRQTRRHRRWMLRMVVYFSAVITGRLVMLCSREIISRVGTYYSVWRCTEMLYILDRISAQETYPQCFASDGSVIGGHASIAVHASSMSGNRLELAAASRSTQGMALWVATLIHMIGIEIYLRRTDESNYTRYGYVLEPKNYDGDGQEPWQYK